MAMVMDDAERPADEDHHDHDQMEDIDAREEEEAGEQKEEEEMEAEEADMSEAEVFPMEEEGDDDIHNDDLDEASSDDELCDVYDAWVPEDSTKPAHRASTSSAATTASASSSSAASSSSSSASSSSASSSSAAMPPMHYPKHQVVNQGGAHADYWLTRSSRAAKCKSCQQSIIAYEFRLIFDPPVAEVQDKRVWSSCFYQYFHLSAKCLARLEKPLVRETLVIDVQKKAAKLETDEERNEKTTSSLNALVEEWEKSRQLRAQVST
jgi:hypothetical protein